MSTPPLTHTAIRNYLNTLPPALFGVESIDDVHISLLPRGVWNFNYLLRVSGKKFVLKVYPNWPISKTMSIDNSGRREFETLRLLSGLNIAPRPVFFDKAEALGGRDALIYEYVTGAPLRYSKQTALAAAEAYARLHRVDPAAATFLSRREEAPNRLMTQIQNKYAFFSRRSDVPAPVKTQLSGYIARSAEYIKQFSRRFKNAPEAIIHADPVAGNIIVDASKLTLIDWQTVMIGDPAFDIWAFTSAPYALWDADAVPGEHLKTLFRQKYLLLKEDSTLKERIALKEPLYLLEYGLHLFTRFYDYKSGNMPPAAVRGREANFEKYGPNAEVVLESLGRFFG